MLQLTETAAVRLHKSLAATRASDNEFKCFRVVPIGEKQMTLKIVTPASNDQKIEHEGDVVLAVPKALRPYFKNKSMDIDKTGQLYLC